MENFPFLIVATLSITLFTYLAAKRKGRFSAGWALGIFVITLLSIPIGAIAGIVLCFLPTKRDAPLGRPQFRKAAFRAGICYILALIIFSILGYYAGVFPRSSRPSISFEKNALDRKLPLDLGLPPTTTAAPKARLTDGCLPQETVEMLSEHEDAFRREAQLFLEKPEAFSEEREARLVEYAKAYKQLAHERKNHLCPDRPSMR